MNPNTGPLITEMKREVAETANAALIASAPQLLAACQSALRLLDNSPLANSETADQLRAAIARATGE